MTSHKRCQKQPVKIVDTFNLEVQDKGRSNNKHSCTGLRLSQSRSLLASGSGPGVGPGMNDCYPCGTPNLQEEFPPVVLSIFSGTE